jgi:predicted DNA-binding transcriptional regulator AlpA
MERLLTEQEAAQRLGLKYAGLRSMRGRGKGPDFVRVGSLVRYRTEDLSRWVAAHVVTTDPTGTDAPKSAA